MYEYTGRFAPSPTGPLHIGSLYTAVATFLDARANKGKWLLRIEDIDTPRTRPGAEVSILKSLEAHALHWDGEILHQSNRAEIYAETVRQLQSHGYCFYCKCSRQQLGQPGEYYPGSCRETQQAPDAAYAIRLKASPPAPSFHDRLLGRQILASIPEGLFLDFVIRRKEGIHAYQLAVVVDDIEQGITSIVRGSDILDSTFRQLYLYHYLKQPVPQYLHIPIITNLQGHKLSKQNLAPAVDNRKATQNLLAILQMLRQETPPTESSKSCADILTWAIAHWDISRIPARLAISTSGTGGIDFAATEPSGSC